MNSEELVRQIRVQFILKIYEKTGLAGWMGWNNDSLIKILDECIGTVLYDNEEKK